MSAPEKIIHGVGINDAEYKVQRFANGEHVWECEFFRTWRSMLCRCYSSSSLKVKPTYSGCSVTHEWLSFSNFRKWMSEQDYKGKHLDKDILSPGNKVYSPDSCVFVSSELNKFLTANRSNKGKWPTGVNWHKGTGKFAASCQNPFTLKRESLGYFDSPVSAHQAWRLRKHELACIYADLQVDPRVAEALRIRFAGPWS